MRDIEQPVKDWQPVERPEFGVLDGKYARLAPLTVADSTALFEAAGLDESGQGWRYMPIGPFENPSDMEQFLHGVCGRPDPMFFSILNKDIDKVCGFATYLRITPEQGSIEVGYIYFSPLLQQTRAATEAMFLMMKNAFALGNRRYEWKCNAANQASMTAAKRLGFTFEGIFRQMMIVKGRNRDTAWFSIIDSEWPAIEKRFQNWLKDENFDENGRQISSL